MVSTALAALLAFVYAAPSLADITNLDYAAFPARGADEDLLSYVTVRYHPLLEDSLG